MANSEENLQFGKSNLKIKNNVNDALWCERKRGKRFYNGKKMDITVFKVNKKWGY